MIQYVTCVLDTTRANCTYGRWSGDLPNKKTSGHGRLLWMCPNNPYPPNELINYGGGLPGLFRSSGPPIDGLDYG